MGLVFGVPVDMQHGGGVYGGLDYAGGLMVAGGTRTALRMPESYPGEVLMVFGVKDDMRQQSVCPLLTEEVAQLSHGTALIVVGAADDDERRVPGPLMRIKPGARLGVIPGPVKLQY